MLIHLNALLFYVLQIVKSAKMTIFVSNVIKVINLIITWKLASPNNARKIVYAPHTFPNNVIQYFLFIIILVKFNVELIKMMELAQNQAIQVTL